MRKAGLASDSIKLGVYWRRTDSIKQSHDYIIRLQLLPPWERGCDEEEAVAGELKKPV